MNNNYPNGYVTGLELHEKIKQENIRYMQREKAKNVLTTILCILLFPITLIVFVIIGLGTKKEYR